MLHLYHSNRLDRLAFHLGELLAEQPQPPLTPEHLVVQHQGMGRWLSLRLADHLGISANIRYQLPAAFIWEMFRRLLEEIPEQNLYQPEPMQWFLYQRLGKGLSSERFTAVRHYLDEGDERSRFELAGVLAACFDRYLVYRPDWIEHWEAGRQAVAGDEWQAALWRDIGRGFGGGHWIRLGRQALERLRQGGIENGALPERVAIFAPTSLSPGYLEILRQLAEWVDIHIYLINPSAEHWVDLVDPLTRGRMTLERDASQLYLEVGNPLLASMAGQARDFHAQLLAWDPGSQEDFQPPIGDSLLAQLQRDILYIEDPGSEPRPRVIAVDTSLQFHNCHSAMREVEVLYDQLLALFQADEELTPSDVLVMTPDMDAYAPYIEAVFSETAGNRRIPYSLSDRTLTAESPLINGVLRLLEIPAGRYPADQVMALLELPAVRNRFGLSEEELGKIFRWVKASGIRWGRSGESRGSLGLPGTGSNSWQTGLDRLMLGYALPGDDRSLFAGLLPFDDLEGTDARPLAALKSFVGALFQLEKRLEQSRSLRHWRQLVIEQLDRFFKPVDEMEAEQIQTVRDLLGALADTAESAGVSEPIPLTLLLFQLRQKLSTISGSERFLSGGVTFSALTPMRTLPFRVICMIGMNDGQFPRDRSAPGFDLMAQQGSRMGDRSQRADDRYLFLETMLSASHCLYFSFQGQAVRDNTPLPPSVLISELLDYLGHGYVDEEGRPASEWLLTVHPLQSFSRRYFRAEGPLFSFSPENRTAAEALCGEQQPPNRIISEPLPEADPAWRQIDIEQLLDFYTNPARYLLRHRLGIHLEADRYQLDPRDPFDLDYFERSRLSGRLLQALQEGIPREESYRLERARGLLPHGAHGRLLFENLYRQVEILASDLTESGFQSAPEPVVLNISRDHFRISGRLTGVGPQGILGASVEQLPDARLLALWIRHLALNLAAPSGVEPVSRWFTPGEQLKFPPQPEAAQRVSELLEGYWQGLSYPLPLFPKSARRYCEALLKGKGEQEALDRAWQRWAGGYLMDGEYLNPYYRLAYPEGDAIDGEFQAVSQRLFAPLLDALESS